jgi:DivIVA domain-containing protein
VESIERIRSATFTVARRGYDTREVDSYLSKLADWLEGGGADQVHSDTIRHELERIGQKTAKVLTAAQEAADSLRDEAEREARQISEAARARAERVRSEADAKAAQTIKEAEAKAIKMVEEGSKRRREIEKVIADLQTRRDAVVSGLEKLSSQLAGAASQGKGLDKGPAATQPAASAKTNGPAAPTRQ